MRKLVNAIATVCVLACPALAQTAYPAPGSTVQTLRPVFGYDFGQPVHNEHISIDGHDFTHIASRNGFRVQITPEVDLPVGQHTIEVTAQNLVGLPVRYQWTFTIQPAGSQNPPAPVSTAPRITPAADAVVKEVRPAIQLEYPEGLRSAKLWLDGQEQTSMLRLNGNSVHFTPAQDLTQGRHQLSTQVLLLSGRQDNQTWSIDVQPPATGQDSGHHWRQFSNFSPPQDATVPNSRPFISADWRGKMSDVRLLVDNTDVTNRAKLTDSRISWSPHYDIAPGLHHVTVQGRNHRGQTVDSHWDFTVDANQGPQGIDFSVDEPANDGRVNKVFDVQGRAPAGSVVRVLLRPLPRRNKVVQFKGKADRAGYFSVPASASWAARGAEIEVDVTVLDAKTGQKLTEPVVLKVRRR